MKLFSGKFFSSLLLGIAMGTGWMTSLRFGDLIGISEILFAFVALLLLLKVGAELFVFSRDSLGATKLYLLLSVFIVAPVVTFVTANFSTFGDLATPRYIPAFMLGVTLLFLLPRAITQGFIDIKSATLVFFLVFTISYFVSIFVLPDETSRFAGFSRNPNQPLFYLATLALLMSFYYPKLLLLVSPVLAWIGLRSGSDAFIASGVLVIVGYLVLRFLFHKGRFRLVSFVFLSVFVLLLAGSLGTSPLSFLFDWFGAADQGNSRPFLLENGISAALASPLFGWGLGSFSGVFHPFQGSEAHNNFIDLAMQFGIPFACLVYWLIFRSFQRIVRTGLILPAAMILGFVASGLFHFSARHFVFWVELAVLLTYLITLQASQPSLRSAKKNTIECAG